MFHVQEVACGFDGVEAAVLQVSGELRGVVRGGVLVPGAIDEKHRHLDALPCCQVFVRVKLQYLTEVIVHLVIFMTVQAADVAIVDALEQRRQVLADSVVDQMPHVVTAMCAEVVEAFVQVLAHGTVDDRGERADHRAFDASRLMRQCNQRSCAAPGEGQNVLGVEMVDQFQQQLTFLFPGQRCAVHVVWLGPARIRLVIQHHVEGGVKVADGLSK